MLLSLQVGEIVDRAQKEEKMEIALKKLDETWTRVQFQFIKHKDTPINTIKMAEEDFEALEDNQVLVQGMMANRYMATFKDEILAWNKKLMNVADVNQVRIRVISARMVPAYVCFHPIASGVQHVFV